MRYLLDSTVLIDHGNGDPGAVALLRRLFEGGHELFTCDVVTCETLSLGDEPHLSGIRALLEALEYVATSPEAARRAGDARLGSHRAGRKLGIADALIGGVATSLGAEVVTRNRPDFERQGVVTLGY
jgi:predicted nucleic acid-binding protein